MFCSNCGYDASGLGPLEPCPECECRARQSSPPRLGGWAAATLQTAVKTALLTLALTLVLSSCVWLVLYELWYYSTE